MGLKPPDPRCESRPLAFRPAKKVPAAREKLGPKPTNAIERVAPLSLHMKVFDTTVEQNPDPHLPPTQHVDIGLIIEKLEERFSFLTPLGVSVTVDQGRFDAADFFLPTPATRRQILLSDGAMMGNDSRGLTQRQFLTSNCNHLVDALLRLGVTPQQKADERFSAYADAQATRAKFETVLNRLGTRDVGITPVEAGWKIPPAVSIVEFWKWDEQDDSDNEDAYKYPGEFEAQTSAHELGHTFLEPPGQASTQDNHDFFLSDVMTDGIGYIPFERFVTLTPATIKEYGGKQRVLERFDELPNHLKYNDAHGLLHLHYRGYPGFDKCQRRLIFEAIQKRWTDFGGLAIWQ